MSEKDIENALADVGASAEGSGERIKNTGILYPASPEKARSKECRKPGYWAVLPAKVRYDEQLRPNAKLLYAEITALADLTGYCWASNEYLAQLFGIAARTVSDLISTLQDRGYISVEVIRDRRNAVVERRILVDRPTANEQPPIAKNGYTPIADFGYTPIADFGYTPIADFGYTPIAKNGAENNINNINNKPPIVPQRGQRVRKAKKAKAAPDWKPDIFAAFWDAYPRGESKQAAIAAWDKLQADEQTLRAMARALKRQTASDEWRRGIGIPYASTWINQRRWEDEPSHAPQQEQYQPGGELPLWT